MQILQNSHCSVQRPKWQPIAKRFDDCDLLEISLLNCSLEHTQIVEAPYGYRPTLPLSTHLFRVVVLLFTHLLCTALYISYMDIEAFPNHKGLQVMRNMRCECE